MVRVDKEVKAGQMIGMIHNSIVNNYNKYSSRFREDL